MRALLAFLTFGLLAIQANAQIDPSSALLLNSGGRSSTRDNGIDSGRYTVRPKSESGQSSSRREEQQKNPRRSQSTSEPAPVATPVQTEEESVGATTVAPTPAPLGVPQPTPQTTPQTTMVDLESAGPAVENATAETAQTPAQMQSQAPKSLVGDRRLNLLELSVAPAFIYNNSDSSFFYRQYFTSAPALAVETNVWFSPTFSLNASYLGTLGGHVSDSFDGSRNVAAAQQWFTAGLRSRRFFGDSVASPVLIFGLDYYEYQFRVASDAALRERLRTTGARLSIEGEIPTGARHSWTFGFSLLPKLQHKEEATAIDFKSGGDVDSNAVSLSLGSRFEFDRTSSIYWKLSHMIEKDLFSGDASVADPTTGTAPSGVAVTNSFTTLQIGYTWGN